MSTCIFIHVVSRVTCPTEMVSLCQSNCCRGVGRKDLSVFSLQVVGDKQSHFFLSRSLLSVELLLNDCLKKYLVQACLLCISIDVRSLTDFFRSKRRAVLSPSRKVYIFSCPSFFLLLLLSCGS